MADWGEFAIDDIGINGQSTQNGNSSHYKSPHQPNRDNQYQDRRGGFTGAQTKKSQVKPVTQVKPLNMSKFKSATQLDHLDPNSVAQAYWD